MRISNIKRFMAVILALTVILSAALPAYAVQPRYADVYSVDCTFGVTNGIAQCYSKVIGESIDHTYTIRMMLYQDDNDYAWWDASGIWKASITQTCYVTRGHEYFIGVHVKAYDENGNFIEEVIAYTDPYYYN